jgi:phenylpropionate dioxygenase-like ring-hydroxylating dioxygenase large terminal subunit
LVEKIMYPMNQWYIAAFSWELADKPLGRTLLNRPVVLFRGGDGKVAALEDRCCHRALPLSCGTLEKGGLRCGYHGLLYDAGGKCIDIPGQLTIPQKACVTAYPVQERDQIVWMWFGAEAGSRPDCDAPAYQWHDDPRYEFRGDVYHYNAPYQLVHDNLLDLSHLGYVHLQTIGGNPTMHMGAKTVTDQDGDVVRVVRHMPNSPPPATYSQAWPFKGRIDRWQEIEFHVSHLRIWTGAVDANTESMDDPARGGFHMRGLHGVTPETENSTHYFWTVCCNRPQDRPSIKDLVYQQVADTFEEDRIVIEAQYDNMRRFPDRPMISIHVDNGPNRARRVVDKLSALDTPAS